VQTHYYQEGAPSRIACKALALSPTTMLNRMTSASRRSSWTQLTFLLNFSDELQRKSPTGE
jgi:hypothetical protein